MPSRFPPIRRIDLGHVDGGGTRAYRGATMAMHSTVGFSLSALGAWALGIALDAAGGPQSSSAWMAAFSVLAAIPLGPVALFWSRPRDVSEQEPVFHHCALGTTQTLA